jgi:hypothetical protein
MRLDERLAPLFKRSTIDTMFFHVNRGSSWTPGGASKVLLLLSFVRAPRGKGFFHGPL